MRTWELKPYTVMDLSPYFFDPQYTKEDFVNYKSDFVGGAWFDHEPYCAFVQDSVLISCSLPLLNSMRIRFRTFPREVLGKALQKTTFLGHL